MALHIKDAEAEAAVRELAELRGATLTEAVKAACKEAISRDRRNIPVKELLADLQAEIRALPANGEKADKAFFDELWGEND
jgi:antitoxin VapB